MVTTKRPFSRRARLGCSNLDYKPAQQWQPQRRAATTPRLKQNSEATMIYINVAVYLCYAISLVAFPFVAFVILRDVMRARAIQNPATRVVSFPVKSLMLFFGGIGVGMSLTNWMGNQARADALSFIAALPSSHSVVVNGRVVPDDTGLLQALKSTDRVLAHHSHPTKMIHVSVESNQMTMRLNLGRDSGDPQEYWVFDPEYRVTLMNEIGRIRTKALDGY